MAVGNANPQPWHMGQTQPAVVFLEELTLMDWISVFSVQGKSAEKECWNPDGLQENNKPHFLTKSDVLTHPVNSPKLDNWVIKLKHVKVNGAWQSSATAVQWTQGEWQHVTGLPAGECNSILFHQETEIDL